MNGAVKEEQGCLFSLSIKGHEPHLEQEEIDDQILEAFRRKGYPLSADANISKLSKKHWVIKDEPNVFIIEQSGNELEIYENKGKNNSLRIEDNLKFKRFGGHKSLECDGDCENCDLRESFLC